MIILSAAICSAGVYISQNLFFSVSKQYSVCFLFAFFSYSSDAPELQLRRLGDLCFMFGHYSLAFQAYHSAKRDFNADQAWLYYAGALEMAALSAFMQGEVTRKAQEYMDEGIITYLNSCK